MKRARSRVGAAVLLLALIGSACTETVLTQPRPELAELRAPLRRIAVVPFSASALHRVEETGPPASVTAQLVARYVAEALEARGVEVVAPDDVAAMLAGAQGDQPVARRLRDERGADAIVRGEVTRWEPREGEAYGSFRPAAVGFRVTLQSAPAGRTLWSAEFDERQQALSENVLRAGQYPGGGSRWLTAEELARWGAQQIVRALPLGPADPGQ
jgi:hypothetical protein